MLLEDQSTGTDRDKSRNVDILVLDQILVAQNEIFHLPDSNRIGEYYTKSMGSLPGVNFCTVCLRDVSPLVDKIGREICIECQNKRKKTYKIGTFPKGFSCKLAELPDKHSIVLETTDHKFGFFIFHIDLPELFESYKPYIRSLGNFLALTLENRLQRSFLQKAHHLQERNTAERTEGLKESEIKYTDLYENAPDMHISVNAKTTLIERCNNTLANALGYSKEEIIGRPIFKIYHPDCLEEVKKAFQLFIEAGEVRDKELQLCRKDGSKIDVSLNVTSVRNEDGDILYSRSTLRDITERKHAEDTVREVEARYRTLVEQIPAIIYICGLDQASSALYISPQIKKMLGFETDEWIKDPDLWVKQIHPDDRDRVLAEVAHCHASGQLFRSDYRLLARDGHIVWVRDEATFLYDKFGHPLVLQGIMSDITEKKRGEEALRKSEAEFKEAQRIGRIGSWDWDANTDTITWSEEYYRIYGFDPTKGTPGYEEHLKVYTPESAARLDAAVKRNLQTGEPYEIDLELAQKDGSSCWITARSETKRDQNGRIIGLRGTAQDITERKQSEGALRRLNRELRAISNCNQILLRTDDEQTLLNEICRIICDEAGYRMTWVGYAENNDAKTVHPLAWAGFDSEHIANTKITWADTEPGHGPVGTAIRSGKYACIQDFITDPQAIRWRENALRYGYRSSLVLPLKDENANTFGVLKIYSTEPNAFTSDEIRFLEELAGNLAFGITTLRTRAERKRAEEALQDSEAMYRSLVTAMAEGAVFQAADGRITAVNPATEQIMGHTAEQMIKRTSDDPEWEAVYEDGTPFPGELHPAMITLRTGKPQYDVVMGIHRPDGALVWISINSQPLISAGETRPYAVVTTFHNITERKQAEEALRGSEERFSKIFRLSPVAIIISRDTDDRIVDVNDIFVKETGYSREEIIGHTVHELQFYADPDERHTISRILQERGSLENFEFKTRNKSGEIGIGLNTTIEINLSEEKHYLTLIQNITERKQAEKELIKAKEKAEESDRLKTAFLCNMSHEIRTPMNAIIGFSEFLLHDDITLEKKQYFSEIIKERSYDLLRIVEDILDISKIEVGQMKIVESDFNLTNVMNELYDYYRLKITPSETEQVMSLKLSLAGNLKNVILKTDGQRLKQILNNLLDNAFKFTKKGCIEFGCNLDSNSALLFFVKDTGIGIPVDKQEIVFDRFRQAEDLLSARQYGGTGLGLSIVKGLTTLMNGNVWLESQIGIGTTAYFTLPLKLSDKNEGYHFENNSIKHQTSWKNKVMLIVEDDKANAEYLKEALSEKDLQILMAYTGEEALQMIEKNLNIDLVLMDIRLPDTNGLNITRIIKKINPKVIVVAQTAYASSNDMLDCIDAGCSDYISKPINYQKLISVIDKAFSNDREKS